MPQIHHGSKDPDLQQLTAPLKSSQASLPATQALREFA